MRTDAEVDHGAAAVHGRRRAVWDFAVDDVRFVLIVLNVQERLCQSGESLGKTRQD